MFLLYSIYYYRNMKYNTFITGTDRPLILKLSSLFSNASVLHTYTTITDSGESSKDSIQLSNFSASLFDLALKKQSNAQTNTIIICLRCPKIHDFFGMDDALVEKHFNTEMFLTFELLRRSLLFLRHHQNRLHETLMNLVVVYPQRREKEYASEILFSHMLESSYDEILRNPEISGTNIIVTKFHSNVSFASKVEELRMVFEERLDILLQKDVDSKNAPFSSLLHGIKKLFGFLFGRKKSSPHRFYKYYKDRSFKKAFK